MKLSGLLEYSMGGFLCLRGYANYKELSHASKENPSVQRQLIEEHKGEMAEFLNKGEYRFFPEVVLSLSLSTGNNFSEVESFFGAMRSNSNWGNKKLGNYQINVFYHGNKTRNRIANISFDAEKVKLNRIDGNHRLSAAAEVYSDFKVPFCLLLCQSEAEESQYSTAIFHNINAKQIPLKLEENLRVILEKRDVFSDEKLKTDPSFGWSFYLTRHAADRIDFQKYPFTNALIGNSKYTYLLDVFSGLLSSGMLKQDDCSIEAFCEKLPDIETALREAQLHSVPQNIAVIGALSYYKLTEPDKYSQFISWIKKNSIVQAPNIHIHDLINIYDKVYESTPKNVFMSMWFNEKTMDTYSTLKDVKEILKRDDGIDLNIIKVDEHREGCSDEIYRRIVNGINDSSLVVADLSFGNHNVHHEIGYAQGRGKKVLLLYHIREGVEVNKEIGSNLSMHDQVRFHNQTELKPILLQKIRDFFGIQTNQ